MSIISLVDPSVDLVSLSAATLLQCYTLVSCVVSICLVSACSLHQVEKYRSNEKRMQMWRLTCSQNSDKPLTSPLASCSWFTALSSSQWQSTQQKSKCLAKYIYNVVSICMLPPCPPACVQWLVHNLDISDKFVVYGSLYVFLYQSLYNHLPVDRTGCFCPGGIKNVKTAASEHLTHAEAVQFNQYVADN
jgi:hypothetical protein